MIDEKEAIARAIYETLGFSYEDRPTGTPYGAWFTALQAADAVIVALESAKPKDAGGWRDIASAPTPVMIGSSFGLGRDYDKLVWFHAGVATHWRPLPEPPSGMLSAAGDKE